MSKQNRVYFVHYRMVHLHSIEKGDPCYATKHGGIITPDKSKAKVWKTWTGAHKAFKGRFESAGYAIEHFEVG